MSHDEEKNSSAHGPFRVPEGYFAQLAESIITRCAEEVPAAPVVVRTWQQRLRRPLIGVAAMLCLTFCCAAIYHATAPAPVLAVSDEVVVADEESTILSAEDYILMDNDDMYRYLAGIY